MGFFSGRITYVRYRVSGSSPLPFGEDVLEKVEQHAIGRHGSGDPADGVSTGWAGGDHVLDTTFDLAKNIVNDALHLAMRVDTDKGVVKLSGNAKSKDEADKAASIAKNTKGVVSVKNDIQVMK